MKQTPLTSLKGIGPKRAEAFALAGIHSAEALLHFYPRDYLDCLHALPVEELYQGQMAFVRVEAADVPKLARFQGKTLVTLKTADKTGKLLLRWFNQPYRVGQFQAGQTLYACGRVDTRRGRSMINPMVMDAPKGILPVYPTLPGLSQALLRDAAECALHLVEMEDTLPEALLQEHGLPGIQEALRSIHFPADEEALSKAKRRIAFEKCLLYLIAVEERRANRKQAKGIAFQTEGVIEEYRSRLPFAPTGAQQRAILEISRDMASPHPMNRLLQGDVGSGKTAVAMFAMLVACKNGYQSALMAPTELLARQHYASLVGFFGSKEVCFLSGSMKKKEREQSLLKIANGEARIVVGTHALFSKDVIFHKLGLAITDEQHRFGVEQRAKVAEKGRFAGEPDVLVMSATPIPRTLALMLLNDLELSILDELPPGRQAISTSFIPPHKRADMYRYIAQRTEEGQQCYVVCPLIDDSEELSGMSAKAVQEELTAFLPGVTVGLLHGKQSRKMQDQVMEAFRKGEIKILVSTTVIEVGVHVERATIMVIENADRFGLAQLHQLRGRVGRGQEKSYCFLLADRPGEVAIERIRTMTETGDGFVIAERDFALRGAGELIGTQQHGQGMWQWILGLGDGELLAAAREAARTAKEIPNLENNRLVEQARAQYLADGRRIALN